MATIKFIDANLVNSEVTLMVGIKYVTITSDSYQAVRNLVSKAGGVIKTHPFVGYIKPEHKYDRYSRSYAQVALTLLRSQRA